MSNTIYCSTAAGTYNPKAPTRNELVSPEDSTIVFVELRGKMVAIQTSGSFNETIRSYSVGAWFEIEAAGRYLGTAQVFGILGRGEDFDEAHGSIPTKTVPFRVFK